VIKQQVQKLTGAIPDKSIQFTKSVETAKLDDDMLEKFGFTID
jgi:hypothetical protein